METFFLSPKTASTHDGALLLLYLLAGVHPLAGREVLQLARHLPGERHAGAGRRVRRRGGGREEGERGRSYSLGHLGYVLVPQADPQVIVLVQEDLLLTGVADAAGLIPGEG